MSANNQVLIGNCLDILKTLPADSIDCIMTSPPYYGLRSYKADPTVWGGRADCEHKWEEEKATLIHENRNNCRGTQEDVCGQTGTAYIKKYDDTKAGFCSLCGAWRGQLGLEPSYKLYLDHLLMITAELKRVLKPSGSLWWNMGDTYAGSNCGYGDTRPNQNFRQYQDLVYTQKPQSKQGLPSKCLMDIPARFAIRMVDEQGWIKRNNVIWWKRNHMPSSVRDRLTNSYEFVYHFVKNGKYYYDLDAIRIPHSPAGVERSKYPISDSRGSSGYSSWVQSKDNPLRTKIDLNPECKNPGDVWAFQSNKEPYLKNNPHTARLHPEDYVALDPSRPMDLSNPNGKNPGDVWDVTTRCFHGSHYAVYPPELCLRPILATCPPDGVVLDPFFGSGTTGCVAKVLGRNYVGIEISKDYAEEITIPRLAKLEHPLHPVKKLKEGQIAVDRIWMGEMAERAQPTPTAYQGKFSGFGSAAEAYGSPRARTQRYGASLNDE